MIADMGPGPGQQVDIGNNTATNNNQTLPVTHTAKLNWLSKVRTFCALFMQNRRGFHEVDDKHPDFKLLGKHYHQPTNSLVYFPDFSYLLICLFQNVFEIASNCCQRTQKFSQSFTCLTKITKI